MEWRRLLTLVYSEVQPGPGGDRIRVRTVRVLVTALLVSLALVVLLQACGRVYAAATNPPNAPGHPDTPRFAIPVADAVVYSVYGDDRLRGDGRIARHRGIDLAAPYGTPVRAASGGEIVYAGRGYRGSSLWGLLVAIDHGDGWLSLYAHLSEAEARVGERVRRGEEIGRIGTSGNATGPHVHVELRHEGEPVDPADYLRRLN
ncbi:M23 family metallopeptidase [Maricaulis sp.]|uniref:M23 family metallopeptidase n=1 Tax=Maricaulis sp. TaxID=1486257 RepID=UPI003A8FCE1B